MIVLIEQHHRHTHTIEQVLQLAAQVPELTAQVHYTPEHQWGHAEIFLLGPGSEQIESKDLLNLPGIVKIIQPKDKYRLIGRHGHRDLVDVGFTYQGIDFHQQSFSLFFGPCAVDHPQSIDTMFASLKQHGVRCARAGAYKPRTNPYDFQGHGKSCLPYVFELAGKHDIAIIAMEVTASQHIEEIATALEQAGHPTGVMLQIGTRNAQNFELLKAVGEQDMFPVLFKRGMGITLEESLNACEYIAAGGNRRIVFALRGVKSHLGAPHRNLIDFGHVPVVKRMTRMPVCIDPSHSVGSRALSSDGIMDLFHATAQGIIAGANMIISEFHPAPEFAMCDGAHAMRLDELGHYLQDIAIVRQAYEQRCQLHRAMWEQKS